MSSATETEPRAFVLAHYIPWFSSKEISGRWGWHWTMNHFDPEVLLENGQRSAASHDYPLLGLYDCADPDVLECQVLQMKFSGLNGIIIDWYGTKTFNDYGLIHRNTEHLIPYLKKANLLFSICYEDQSLGHMAKAGAVTPEEALDQGKTVFQWLDRGWFRDPSYLKVEQRPVFLVFGPQYFQREHWEQILKPLSTHPLFYALPHLFRTAGADHFFEWPPVSQGRTIPPSEWRQHSLGLFPKESPNPQGIPVVFPGFHDIYKEAGLHESYGFIAEEDGQTFRETLDFALNTHAPIVQIATWNDYGEDTVIEPTSRLGYHYLETLQKRLNQTSKQAPCFTSEDLRLPQLLHDLRKKYRSTPAVAEKLDRASTLLFESKCQDARAILLNIP